MLRQSSSMMCGYQLLVAAFIGKAWMQTLASQGLWQVSSAQRYGCQNWVRKEGSQPQRQNQRRRGKMVKRAVALGSKLMRYPSYAETPLGARR